MSETGGVIHGKEGRIDAWVTTKAGNQLEGSPIFCFDCEEM
jgi:hypothetical protein